MEKVPVNTDLLDEMEVQGPDTDLVPLDEIEQKSKEKYGRFMMPEVHTRQDKGVDEKTGWRYEYWDIGMTRNAKSENKTWRKVFIDPIPHIVLDQNIPLRGWYKNKYEPAGVRPRPCFTDSILTQPYGGFCAVGCAFCYINNGSRGYRGQGVTVVDPTYPEKTIKQFKSMRTGAAVYMSSFIDPFLEVEKYYHNTKKVSTAAVDEGLPIFFLTRKKVPGWAYDLLKQNKYSYMQFSINTPSPTDWRLLSPKAESLGTMLDQVAEMHRQKIYISIQVNPIMAGVVTHEDILKLIHILKDRGADHLIFKFVEIVYPSAPSMIKQIRVRFRGRADKFEALFTQNIGGVKSVDEDYRKEGLMMFWKECKKAKITMSLCYEYEYERNKKGEVINKVGRSMGMADQKGQSFISADQCHGHRVPVYSRKDTMDKFKPIEACPTTGCLHCADDSGGEKKVPCGNELLAFAPAWTPEMLKQPAYTLKHGGEPSKRYKELIDKFKEYKARQKRIEKA